MHVFRHVPAPGGPGGGGSGAGGGLFASGASGGLAVVVQLLARREPQSLQSWQASHEVNSAPGPPSSHSPSDEKRHVLRQMPAPGGPGGGGIGDGGGGGVDGAASLIPGGLVGGGGEGEGGGGASTNVCDGNACIERAEAASTTAESMEVLHAHTRTRR